MLPNSGLKLRGLKRLACCPHAHFGRATHYLNSLLLIILLWLASGSGGVTRQLPPPTPTTRNSTAKPHLLSSGNQISLNGRNLTAPTWLKAAGVLPARPLWYQEQDKGQLRTAINDIGLMQLLGVELLDTKDVAKQPIQWFSSPNSSPTVLSSWQNGRYRYLDVTRLVPTVGWQMQVDGDILRLTTPEARIRTIREGKQPWGDRIVVDLDRPTPWQVTQQQLTTKPNTTDVEADDPYAQKLPPQTTLTPI